MSKYKVLLIGLGGQGLMADAPGSGNEHKVISFAKALKEREDVLETYVFDYDTSREDKPIELYGFKQHSIALHDYNIIIIATPDDTHRNVLEYPLMLRKKPKLVICEKPLCMTLAETEEIVELYEETGIPILVNYTRRFIPELRDLNTHGKALVGHCSFNRGLEHTGTHALDFFNMLGVPLDKQNLDSFEAYNLKRMWDIKVVFEDGYVFHEHRINDEPVHKRYDFHMRHVIDNAVNFLEGEEGLFCTMYDALECMKILEELKEK